MSNEEILEAVDTYIRISLPRVIPDVYDIEGNLHETVLNEDFREDLMQYVKNVELCKRKKNLKK